MLPATFTCDGEGQSPHLAWSDAPEGVQSFALRFHDPDAPSGNFDHWLVANIPATVREISRNGPLPVGSLQIINDSGQITYCPPCPPSGIHRYIFTLYALNVPTLPAVKQENFLVFVEAHSLVSATLTSRYQRQRPY